MTYVDESREVSLLDVVEDAGLVEAGEVRHVLLLVELGRVHLLDVVLGDQLLFAGVNELDQDLIPAVGLNGGRHESLGLMGHPDQLFRGPFGLRGGVVERIPVDHQVLQVGVRLVHVHHLDEGGVRHFLDST